MPLERRRGFPWIPFLAILGLVTLGVVFILAEHGSKPARSATKTSSAPVDELTNSTATSGSNFPSVQTDTTSTSAAGGCTTAAGGVQPATTNAATPGIATTADGFLTTATSATAPGSGAGGAPASGQQAGSGAATCTNSTPTSTGTSTGATSSNTSTFATTASTATSGSTAATGTGTSTTGTIASGGKWPDGKHGYTVVLASFAKDRYSRTDAEARSIEAQQKGVSSGVLDSDGFTLRSGLWVVFAGVFDTQKQADDHVTEVAAKGYQGAYVRKIDPR